MVASALNAKHSSFGSAGIGVMNEGPVKERETESVPSGSLAETAWSAVAPSMTVISPIRLNTGA